MIVRFCARVPRFQDFKPEHKDVPDPDKGVCAELPSCDKCKYMMVDSLRSSERELDEKGEDGPPEVEYGDVS